MDQLSLSEFADKMNQIMPVIIREFARRQFNQLKEITLPQFLLLGLLDKEGEMKMTDLARFLHVTTPAMTGTVDRLARDGYALRSREAKDRRIIKVSVTPKGSALVKKVMEQRRKMVIKIFAKFSEHDRQEYLRILTQIKEILSKQERG